MGTLTEPTAAQRPDPVHPVTPLRIALLSPYSGANLGDAAIQEAVIQNLRRRCPGALISGITANPDLTAARHGIPCVPMTRRSAEHRTSARPASRGVAAPEQGREGASLRARARARALAKQLPVLGPALRVAAHVARGATAAWREVRQLGHDLRFARRHDAIIAAGGGQLDEEWGGPWAHPYVLFKWALVSRLVGAQFLVLSVGVGALRHPLSRWFVRRALRLASYRSYRDPGSKALLHDIPFTRGDNCRPDLAFSLLDADGEGQGEQGADLRGGGEGRACVGVSPIAFGHPAFWPTRQPTDHTRYLRELTGFVQWLVERGHRVVLFASGGVDHAIISDLLARLTTEPQGRASLAQVRVARDETLAELVSELRAVDLVVASRLHGVILAHLLGKPTLAVSFDRKVDAHMHDVGMERYCLDLHTVDGTRLARAFTLLEGEARAVRTVLASARRAMRESLDAQYDTVVQLMAHRRTGI